LGGTTEEGGARIIWPGPRLEKGKRKKGLSRDERVKGQKKETGQSATKGGFEKHDEKMQVSFPAQNHNKQTEKKTSRLYVVVRRKFL